MGGKVPEPIRRKVLREWLEGISRRQIARDNQIGTGTVSEIIKTIKEINSEARIDILRETVKMLRREGLSIDDFAQSIHLKQFLNKLGLNDEQLEDFVRPLEVHCFKRGLTPEKFMNLVEKLSCLSDNLGIPVEELPKRINGLKRSVDDISFEIRDLIIKKDRAISSYNTTVADLEEYRRNRPLIETLKAKDEELERERERRINLESELLEKENEWSIHEDEVKRINEGLEIPIDPPELYELAKDLFHHPSKYPDVIRTMRERSGPQAALVDMNKVNIFNPPQPPARSPSTLLSLPSGTPIYMSGTTSQNATQPTQNARQSEFPSSLLGLKPYTGTTTATQPTNTLPFNNSNTTTAITLAPPPSASNPTPNNITSIGSTTSESNTTPTPSTPSIQQTITRGCGQGTDNSTCRSNPNPPPTQQNSATNLGDRNTDPNDRSCLQQNINNKSPDNNNENNNNGG